MKKIAVLFVSMLLGTTLIYGQTGQTVDNLLKSSAKSDAEIQDPKKNIKSATWEKRGNLFLEIAQFNTKGLYQGMQQTGLGGAEMMVGKPKDIKQIENGELWIYERINLRFANGVLENWEETNPIDPKALDKAYEAYLKAASLDPKDKFKQKNDIKLNISLLRGMFTSIGVENFSNKKYAEAVKYLEKALELAEWPKAASDTSFRVGLVTYYTGLIAFNGGDYATAEKYYLKCIEKEYEAGTPYNGLAAVYKEMKQPEKELETLQKGFQKYPDSKDVLIGFINYYLTSGQSDKALEKLEQAIADDPKNPTFVFAKATLFDNMSKDSSNKYSAEEKQSHIKSAINYYKKALEINPEYFEANYNLGAVYFNEAVYRLKEADLLPVREREKFDKKIAEAKTEFENALPYLEKAHQIAPIDRSTIQTLLTIYHRLQNYAKKNEMQEKLDNLPADKGGL
jgi:tetratricopeptide (TPR) repeat protein